MNQPHIRRLRRVLIGIALLSAVWAAFVATTGGFVLHAFGLPITSRNPRNPLWLLLISALLAWALPAPDRKAALTEWWLRNAALVRSFHESRAWTRWADPARVIGLAAIAAEVFFWAGARPLWLDEQMIAINLRERSLFELAGPLWLGQAAPFGWLALQRSALVSFGAGELGLRLVPMLFGCGLIAVATWLGRRTMSSLGAGVFVLLCAVGQWLSHYAFELKHYSADAFWGLLLPALAAWAMEADLAGTRTRRHVAWWCAATAGHWFSYGALLATPPCALVLVVDAWRRGGWRPALHFSLIGTAWLAAFGAHYLVSLHDTATNDVLREYWMLGFPPESGGIINTLGWLAGRMESLASTPGGTAWWKTFWLVAFGGFALAGPRRGVLLASIPLCALALGFLRIVPLHDRLALWIVPVLYFGVALFVEGWFRRASYSMRPRRLRLMATLLIASLGVLVCADVVARGWREYRLARWPDSNHGLDDRAAIRWLMDQRHPGDIVMTTHLGAPALWWYGNIPISGVSAGGMTPDGVPIVEVGLEPGQDCSSDHLVRLLTDRQRVLVYTGFPDQPLGFDTVLLQRLTTFGVLVAERSWAISSRAAVVDLGSGAKSTRGADASAEPPSAAVPAGCVSGRAARRW